MTNFGRISLITLATLGASLLGTSDAEAGGRFRFSGHAGVRWGGGVRVGPSVNMRWSRPAPIYRPHRWQVTGRVYIGPTYTYRPFYNYYQPAYVPSYYEGSYYPVQAGPSVGAATVVVGPRAELPRLGIGLFAGGASVEDRGSSTSESSDIGVLGRFRLSGGLLLEGELGKTSYEENLRVDRRLGASLVYEFGAHNRFAPYILAGLGVQEAETNGGSYNASQSYAEVGAGLRFAVTPKFHLTADLRLGARGTMSNDEMETLGSGTKARTIAPPATDSDDPSEEYTRGRISAILYF